MPLPDLIEIVPLDRPVLAEIAVPGSKSLTNRALVLAALGPGETVLEGALWSEDTQVMVDCLQELGFMVRVDPDPREECNRTISVYGLGGKVPPGGTAAQPRELFVGNAGTAARFLTALVCLGQGVYRIQGVPRMHERPQAAIFRALRELGYRIDSANDKLPASIHGAGPRQGSCRVSVAESSQFASALLLGAQAGGWRVQVVDENAAESPYAAMTAKLIASFARPGSAFRIEPDTSSGSYFWAAGWLLQKSEMESHPRPSAVTVARWPISGWQIDAAFPRFWPLPPVVSRQQDLGDSIMTAIVLAPFGGHPVKFIDLGRMRVQECDRVRAIRFELTKCGAEVIEQDDTLEVIPSALHGAEIETYADHRMAMCFAILGLVVPGIRIKNPACVNKTFPNFFQKLAAAPPMGLGATVLEAATGKALRKHELFAE